MESKIKKLMSKSLSNYDILKIIQNKANLITYPDIHKYKSLDELLGKHKACIILYETKPLYGHWCCIFKLSNDCVEFFDPYGLFPDTEKKFINKDYQKLSNQYKPYLKALMLESPYILTYNHFPFQEKKVGVNSCGRWCAIRLLFRHLALDDFIKIFGKKRHNKHDFYITLLTKDY